MANEQNLIPMHQTSEEAKKNGRKGGIASGKARRERRLMRDTLNILLDTPIKKGKVDDLSKVKNLSKEQIAKLNLTTGDLMLLKVVQKAVNGDPRAIEFIRDQVGERPVEVSEVKVDVDENDALTQWIKKLKENPDLKDEMKE